MDIELLSREPLRLAVTFAEADACFHGHFPDRPVVPGSLLIGLCLWSIRKHAGQQNELTVRRFAFDRFAGPGRYELHIDAADAVFHCALTQEETIFARGRIAC